MKLTPIFLSLLLSLGTASGGLAQEFTKGQVTKIDAKQKKVTVKHEELKNLEMPAMTMVFGVADEAMLKSVKVGQAIQFVADRVNGRLTITQLK